MRKIKFRAFLKDIPEYKRDKVNRMYEVYSIDQVSVDIIVDGLCNSVLKKYVELMQFTGLLDKNGREIYEGDILRCVEMHDSNVHLSCNGKIPLWIVEYHQASFCVPCDEQYWEVIGNIYEHSELLQDKGEK